MTYFEFSYSNFLKDLNNIINKENDKKELVTEISSLYKEYCINHDEYILNKVQLAMLT